MATTPLLLIAIAGLWVLLMGVIAHLGRSLPWSTSRWVAVTGVWWGPAVLLTAFVPGTAWLNLLWAPIALAGVIAWWSAATTPIDEPAGPDGGRFIDPVDQPVEDDGGGFAF